MPTWPARNETIQKEKLNSFWEAIEPIFDNIAHLRPLPRSDWDILKTNYITERKNDENSDIDSILSRLPASFRKIKIGPKDCDLIDFLINSKGDRSLILEGPRGSGKTTMLHYVESAIIECGFKTFPILIIVDCLQDRKDLTKEELVTLLKEEIENTAKTVCRTYKENTIEKALLNVSAILSKNPTYAKTREAFRKLKRDLNKDQFYRIDIIFDNLDQNFIRSVNYGIELAKEIQIASGVGTVTVMRPGCLEAIYSRGDARAFFNFEIKVNSPKSLTWIQDISWKIKKEADLHQILTGNVFRAYRKKLSTEIIELAFKNLLVLLKGRRSEDDVLQIMDAVAADDIRHLVLMIRRLLRHRDLPGRWLIGLDEKYPNFHPLVGLFEGAKLFFSRNVVIPNLLSMIVDGGRCDFLICHRILLILSSSSYKYPIDTGIILERCKLFGYDKKMVVKCLKIFHEFLIVRSTNAEFVDPDGPLPKAFFLTESGIVYFSKLLQTTDYLLSAVMDVQLKHEALNSLVKSKTDIIDIPFRVQMDSLIEYIFEVCIAEEKQIRKLLKLAQGEDYLHILDLLRQDGLYIKSLRNGLYDAYQRSMYSSIPDIISFVPEIHNKIGEIDKLIVNLEKELTFAYRNSVDENDNTIETVIDGKESEIQIHHLGNIVDLTATVKTYQACSSALIGLSGNYDNKFFSVGTVAGVKECRPGTNIQASFTKIPGVKKINHDSLKTHVVLGIETFHGNVALLVSDNTDGVSCHLRFHTISGGESKCFDIGKDVKIDSLKNISQEIIEKVNTLVIANKLSREDLKIFGTKLAKISLTREGQNILASHYNSIKHLIIFSSEKDIFVPWEWIRPQPTENHMHVEMIGTVWNTMRWPVTSSSDVISGILRLSDNLETKEMLPLITISDKFETNKNWRKSPPEFIGDLLALLRKYETVHIIGHYVDDDGSIQLGGININVDLIDGYPFFGPKNIILTGCSAGKEIMDKNIPVAIAKQKNTIAWAPISAITMNQAEFIDTELEKYLRNQKNSKLEKFFKIKRTENPIYCLYVRYGF